MDPVTENILQGKSPDPVAITPITVTPQPISVEKTPTTDSGKADPASGQIDVSAKTDQQIQQSPSVKTEQEDAKKVEDNLKNLLGFAESVEQKAARLEREYSASSKEARRVSESNKKLAQMLKEQGLDLVEEKGIPIGLTPNKSYSKEAPDLDIKFKELTEAEQELFVESPDKAIKLVLERAKQAFVRAMPTLDRAPAQVSPEREAEAMEFLSKETWTDGSSKHGDLAENAGLIQQIMTAPDASKAFKEFAAQEPEKVREYLNLKIRAAKAFLKDSAAKVIAAKTEKELKAAKTPDFGPAGGGGPALGVASDDIGSAIAKASHGY